MENVGAAHFARKAIAIKAKRTALRTDEVLILATP